MIEVQSSDKTVQILTPFPVGKAYSYMTGGQDVNLGDFVVVPLGKKQTVGLVWSLDDEPDVDRSKLKQIIAVADMPPMPDVHRKFINWISIYTMADLGSTFKMSMPKMIENAMIKPLKKPDVAPCVDIKTFKTGLDLSNDQVEAAKVLTKAIQSDGFSPILLDGVTGSGKTEVYFEALSACFAAGKQALVLLPEIGLSSQFIDRFKRRFGTEPAIWHSDVTPAKKRKIWRGVIEGQTKCVVGARSALMLPFSDLGLIVVDEEHDQSYKQEDGVIYNARDMAIVRAKLGEFPVVLASATPSLETMQNVWDGKYKHVVLPSRFGPAVMPDVKMIDMCEEKTTASVFLSDTLRTAMMATKERGEQSLLFLNRRGYAPLTLCRKCGHRFQCPSCTAWLVEHRKTGRLHCHHCDFDMRIPKTCPECEAEDSLVACGPGVERIAEEARMVMPDANVLLLSSDITNSPKALEDALNEITSGEADVVIGTQLIAKGHNFPKLTCVGVVDADIGLSGGDMRAAERTFQLLHQVSGRAGRSALKGTVYLQSYMPDHTVMQALAAGQRDPFLQLEARERQAANMPPYGKLAGLIISGPKPDMVENYARALARFAPAYTNIQVLGPAPAMLAILRGKHRWRFLLRAPKDVQIQKIVSDWVATVKKPSNVQLKIDIDPQSFF